MAEGDRMDEHVGGILHRGPACLQAGVPGMSDGPGHCACGHHDINRYCKAILAMAIGASSEVLRGRNSELFNY